MNAMFFVYLNVTFTIRRYLPSCASPTSCYVGLGGPLEASSSKDLYLWRAMQERLKETRGLNVSLVVDTMNVKGFVIPVTVSHR